MNETIVQYVRKNLRIAGSARFDGIATATGVAHSFIRKVASGDRKNPRINSIEPLYRYFRRVEAGEVSLPDVSEVRVSDQERIQKLGGPSAVARLLEQSGGRPVSVQRVQNWLVRGIPAAVKVEFPGLFMAPMPSEAATTTDKQVAT